MNTATTIGANKVITMQYSLTTTEGVVVREASGKPVTYLHGSGVLFPRLERELESHRVGDIVTARLLPEDAFGKRNTDLLHSISMDELPPDETIEIGGQIVGQDDEGTEITFVITAIEDNIVSLDGNHPLAGQSLLFEIEVQEIREAPAAELRTGKARHDAG